MKYPSMADRLLALSFRDDESGCWVWLGTCSVKGYGKVSVRIPGRRHPIPQWAHRLSVICFLGYTAAGICGRHVDHLCRNPRCINPEHLRVVSPSTNLSRRRQPVA